MNLAPIFMIDLTLYPTEMGGRIEPLTLEGVGLPCRLTEKSEPFYDCRLFLNGQHIAPGETKRVCIRFSFAAAAPLFRAAGKFYLWDGRNIGEAVVVPP